MAELASSCQDGEANLHLLELGCWPLLGRAGPKGQYETVRVFQLPGVVPSGPSPRRKLLSYRARTVPFALLTALL